MLPIEPREQPSPLLESMLCGVAVELAGDDGQKASLLPGLAAGETIGAVAWTELEASWEPAHVQAVAQTEGSDYVLSGTKTHVAGGPTAGLVACPTFR